MKMLTQAEFAQRLSAPIFQQLSATVDALGVEAYIVGGYVRDLLL